MVAAKSPFPDPQTNRDGVIVGGRRLALPAGPALAVSAGVGWRGVVRVVVWRERER